MSSNGMLRDIFVMTLKTIQLKKKLGDFLDLLCAQHWCLRFRRGIKVPGRHQMHGHLLTSIITRIIFVCWPFPLLAGDIRKTKWSFLKPLQLDDRSVTEIWSIHVLSSLNPPAQDPGIFKRTAVKSISFISTLGNTWVIALASIWDVWDSQYLGRAKRSVVKRPWDFL